MKNTTNDELTVERVCEKLTVVRNDLIGDEGEAIAMVQMFDAELFGRLVGETGLESVALTEGGVYLLLELPFGHHFPLQRVGGLSGGFTPIKATT